MTKTHNNNKNHHKKKIIIKNDISNNYLFNDIQNKNIKSSIITPLQQWDNQKRKVSFNSNNLNNLNKKKLNIIKNPIFMNNPNNPINMSLDDIIKKIKEERQNNAKKKLHKSMKKICNSLDDISNNNLLLLTDKKNQNNLHFFIKDIDRKYNFIFNNPNKNAIVSKISPMHPPGLFPQMSFFDNKNMSHTLPPLPQHIRVPIEIKRVDIEEEIDSLADILNLIEKYPLTIGIKYNINMAAIHNIKIPLQDLNNMIGMEQLKNNVVDQIIYFMQDLHMVKNKNEDFMHTVIYGPPGSGKTEIAKIIGQIFCKMGLLKKNIFRKVTRSDLIAGYLGQTAMKTRDVVNECIGGVLFIDEAYALGNSEKRDSFAKECIDTLCESLSDNKGELMVIIAGYEKDLDKCFFAYNQGLNSRFPWRFKTDDYSASDLNLIFQKKIKDAGWSVQEEIKDSWFEQQKDYFKYFGRDMETLFAKTKIAHSRRVFCKPKIEKTKLIMKDIEKGFAMFIDNNEVKSRKGGTMSDIAKLMYV